MKRMPEVQEVSMESIMEARQDLFDWVTSHVATLQSSEIKAVKHIKTENSKGGYKVVHRRRVILTMKDGSIVSFSKEHYLKPKKEEVQKIQEISNDVRKLHDKLNVLLTDCSFSFHTSNIFKNSGIIFVGDLVKLSDRDILLLKNSGRKDYNEMKNYLSERDLTLEMDIGEWKRPE